LAPAGQAELRKGWLAAAQAAGQPMPVASWSQAGGKAALAALAAFPPACDRRAAGMSCPAARRTRRIAAPLGRARTRSAQAPPSPPPSTPPHAHLVLAQDAEHGLARPAVEQVAAGKVAEEAEAVDGALVVDGHLRGQPGGGVGGGAEARPQGSCPRGAGAAAAAGRRCGAPPGQLRLRQGPAAVAVAGPGPGAARVPPPGCAHAPC
jgi:hypothetical protein